jgi:transketolase
MRASHEQLAAAARQIRIRVLQMAHAARTPHVGSALSCADILAALYFHVLRIDPAAPRDERRDRFLLSKGHGCTALYAALALRGFCPAEVLEEYARDGGRLPEHPAPGCLPGVEFASGSLGHALAVGAGLALSARLRGLDFRVFVLLSDGECYEGSVWEAAIFAAAQRLGSLTAIVDFNLWSAAGRTAPALQPLAAKWKSFGWAVREIDGHDSRALVRALAARPDARQRPRVIVARTVKGKGVSFMEDELEWHYRPPSAEDLERALAELTP